MHDIQVIGKTDDGRVICILSNAFFHGIPPETREKNKMLVDIYQWSKSFMEIVLSLGINDKHVTNPLCRAAMVHDSTFERIDGDGIVSMPRPPKLADLEEKYLSGYSPLATLVLIAQGEINARGFGKKVCAVLKSKLVEKGLLEVSA